MTECCCDDIIIEVNEEGIDGVGIASIELVNTVGITKNYRINLTNGTYFDYSISDGSSIASISKTSSAGLVDTYTVLLTSGDTSTFEVTNGNGIASIVKTSTDNLTDVYTISYTNGTTSTFSVTNGNSIASVSKVSTQVLTDTYEITYTDEDKSPDTFTVVNGRGITSIAKTSTSGLVDTYTVTYNDNSTSTYTVTNGMPATHEWNGTVLTITSASGTSSADLKGDKGDAATIAVGTVTTTPAGTNATITNSGDEHDAVFDFTIPRGNTGNGIASITLQSTSGLVKTYRVTYTDGEHYDFNVADGNGIASISILSESGATKTYRILFTDGTHFDYDVVDGSDEWGAIVGNLSDQTDLQNALDSKAPVITETASGSIISFTDGSTLPVESLTVAIEPVQDLHGYDNPWPAGGGKNLCPLDSMTTTSGGNLNSGQGLLGKVESGETYTLSFYCNTASTVNITVRIVDSGGTQTAQTSGNLKPSNRKTYTFTASVSGDVCVNANLGSTYANVKAISDIQLELGSTATTYQPYSNICPISGWTSAKVQRSGVNLFDKTATNTDNGYVDGKWLNVNGGLNTDSADAVSEYIQIVGNKSYTLTGAAGTNVSLVFYDSNKSIISGKKYNWQNPFTFTSPLGTAYLRFSITKSLLDSTQLEAGDSATAYKPFVANTIVTIDLDGTRYGGTLDVTTGMLTVTKAIVDLGTLNWGTYNSTYKVWDSSNISSLVESPSVAGDLAEIVSDTYKNVTWNNLYDNRSTPNYTGITIGSVSSTTNKGKIRVRNGSEVNTPTGQLVYKLKSPVTVQLTPSQMSTLLGENHIWADTGNVEVTYRADTKRFVQEQIAESQLATRSLIAGIETEMVASKNYSTGDLLIVGDTLYKTTANIGSGSAITVGTNVAVTTVAEQLIALANA